MRLFSHYTLVLPVACIALTSFSPATFAGFDMSYQGVKSSGDYSSSSIHDQYGEPEEPF